MEGYGMTRTEAAQRDCLNLVVIGLGALGLSGCFYGPPPNYQPLPVQPQVAPTPANPGTTFAPVEESATSLDQVPDAPANQVLAVPQPRDPGTFHAVRAGDTLTGIASQYGVTVEDLMQANGFEKDTILQQGFQLRIPGSQDTGS